MTVAQHPPLSKVSPQINHNFGFLEPKSGNLKDHVTGQESDDRLPPNALAQVDGVPDGIEKRGGELFEYLLDEQVSEGGIIQSEVKWR